MDEIKPTSDRPEAKKQATGDTPLNLIIVKEEMPKDADAKESKDNKRKSDNGFEQPPERSHLPSRIWLWIRHDTASTDWLIVLLTAVIAGTSYLQWREIRAGGTDTHDLAIQAKNQAEKMKDMSDAADKIRKAAEDMVTQEQRIADNAKASLDASNTHSKAALGATIEDFQRDQRAWVGIGHYSVKVFNNRDPFKLEIPFINSGKSPAVSADKAIAYAISDHVLTGPPSNYDYFFQPAGAVAPQGTYTLTITNGAVPQIYDAIKSGTRFLYFFGKFRYHDVYNPKLVHTTNFCMVFDRESQNMALCQNGNEMD